MSEERSRLITGRSSLYTDVDSQNFRPEIAGSYPKHSLKGASNVLFIVQGTLVVLFATFAKESYIDNDNFNNLYQLLIGLEIVSLIGFGYLRTYLRRYGMGALGFTVLITAVGLQWGILTEAFISQLYTKNWSPVPVNILTLLTGLDQVVALIISFGAVLGNVSPLQLVVMIILESVFYSINKCVLLNGYLNFIDAGRSIQIHMFGAYFGLSVAYFLRRHTASSSASSTPSSPAYQTRTAAAARSGGGDGSGGGGGSCGAVAGTGSIGSTGGAGSGDSAAGAGNADAVTQNSSRFHPVPDVMSMLGTLFLFIYWPSFNSSSSSLVANSHAHAQQRAVVGTILSLCASTVGTFFASSYLNTSTSTNDGGRGGGGGTGRDSSGDSSGDSEWESSKFRPVDIQHATLAGGVAIGSVCTMTLSAGDCLLIGFIAGVASTAGFTHFQPYLQRTCGLQDSCGIHNLHGIPSLIGGLASVVLCYFKAQLGHDMPGVFLHANQWKRQVAAICITLTLSVCSGALTAAIVKLLMPSQQPFFSSGRVANRAFDDDYADWEMEGVKSEDKYTDVHQYGSYNNGVEIGRKSESTRFYQH